MPRFQKSNKVVDPKCLLYNLGSICRFSFYSFVGRSGSDPCPLSVHGKVLQVLHPVRSIYVLCGLQAFIRAPTNDREHAFSITFLLSIFSSLLTIFAPEYPSLPLRLSLQASPQKNTHTISCYGIWLPCRDGFHAVLPCVCCSLTDWRWTTRVGMDPNGPRCHYIDLQSWLITPQKNDTFTHLKMHSRLWQIINKALSVTTGFVLVCRDG